MENDIDHLAGSEKRRTSQYWGVRALLAVLLTSGLIWYVGAEKILDQAWMIDGAMLALATGLLILQYIIAAWRWHFVSRQYGIGMSWSELQAIFGAGALADMVALISVAGVSVRGVLLARKGVSMTGVIGAVFVERFAALSGFGACFLAGAVLALPKMSADTTGLMLNALFVLVPGAIVAFVAIKWLGIRFQVIERFLTKMRSLTPSWQVISALLLMSAIIIWIGFAVVALLARGLNMDVSIVFFLILMPVVAFLSSLPVSIGGWGVREGAMVTGLALFGIPAHSAAALSITYGLLGTVVTICLAAASAVLWGSSKQAKDG